MTANLIVILGPTASGKTKLAARMGKDLGAEIISADSRQVYRGMNIGTGKDLGDYVVDGVCIPYHLIDVVDPDYEFNVFEYQRLFFKCFFEIRARNVLPILTGGTGLYIEAVLQKYRMSAVPVNCVFRTDTVNEEMEALKKRFLTLNPSPHNTTDLLEKRRLIRAIEIAERSKNIGAGEQFAFPRLNPIVIGIRWERPVIRQRITSRLRERLAAGMIEEVKDLHDKGIDWEKMNFFGLEYRYIGLYLQGKIDYQEMFRQLNTRIHQFAKRQETWFRKMERQGTLIYWLDNPEYKDLKSTVEALLSE